MSESLARAHVRIDEMQSSVSSLETLSKVTASSLDAHLKECLRRDEASAKDRDEMKQTMKDLRAEMSDGFKDVRETFNLIGKQREAEAQIMAAAYKKSDDDHFRIPKPVIWIGLVLVVIIGTLVGVDFSPLNGVGR